MKLVHLVPRVLKQFLVERNAYNQYLANVDVAMLKYYSPTMNESCLLNQAFNWNKSPEGFHYWMELHNEYVKSLYEANSDHS